MADVFAKSVLIVDDNPLVRRALCQLFSSESDFRVCGEAENGRDAIEKAQQLRPDLIVLDISMPVMNGFDAALELKRLMPTVPVIMFSEYSDLFAKRAAAYSRTFNAFVSKSQPGSLLTRSARTLLNGTVA